MSSNGTASSIFGYSGEQIDTSGLVFLRARYMQPTLGIFLARDPWSGEVMRPGSMNGWGYVEGQPTYFVDASGQEPEWPGLDPDATGHIGYEYSCNCGWIDWAHADSVGAGPIIKDILLAQLRLGKPSARGLEIDVQQGESKLGESGGVYGRVRVDKDLGMNSHLMFNVALGVFESLQTLFEKYQGGDPFWLRGIFDKRAAGHHSSFSEEDLTSDLIGFYRAVWETRGLSSEDSLQEARRLCKVVGMNDDVQTRLAKQKNIWIWYRQSPLIGGFQDNFEWGQPRLVNVDDPNPINNCGYVMCPSNARAFPREFQEYTAQPPRAGGLWEWTDAHAEFHTPITSPEYHQYSVDELNK